MGVGRFALAAVAVALSACQPALPPQDAPRTATPLRYESVETQPLGEGAVNLIVRMSGPATEDDLLAYADCAVAGYALRFGYGFARHVRTNMQIEGSLRVADAIYTVSPTLPRGLQTIDAEVMASTCAEQGIPTV